MRGRSGRSTSLASLVLGLLLALTRETLGATPGEPAQAARRDSSSSGRAKARPRPARKRARSGSSARKRRARAAPTGVAAAEVTGTSPGSSDTVIVEVVDVAGGRAYLTPGAAAQIRIGNRVRIAGRRYSVIAINTRNIVVNLGKGQLTPGQRGEVTIRPAAPETFATRPAPRSIDAFVGRWRAPLLPADSQVVRSIPLGLMRDERRNRAAFSVDYQRIQPLSGEALGIGRTRLRALLHTELTDEVHLDADAFAEFWQASDLALRPKNASRPFISVRQIELGYRGDVLQGGIGRLRYASRTLGSLDGARVSGSLSDTWSVSAFGGTLADPLNGSVSTDAARFGTELTWQDAESSWQPRSSLTFHGSSFLGELDERRVAGIFESFPSFGHLGARAEVSLFPADNPWGASSAELTAAGAEATLRIDALRLAGSLDMRQPERSLWLASFLPRGYFCVAEPTPAAAIEPCAGGERRYAAAFNAAWEATLWTADAGTTLASTRRAKADQATGFVNLRRRDLIGKLRLDAGGTLSRGSLYESAAFNISPGTPLAGDSADLSVYYRPSWMRYRAELTGFVEHGFGTRFWWAPSSVLDLSGSVDALVGRDVDVLIFQVSAAYRPRF